MKLTRKYTLRDGETMTVTEIERHRNGIGGLGFYAVRFIMNGPEFTRYDTPDGKYAEGATAIYENADTEFIAIYDDDGRVAVVAPGDLSRTMRGHDYFGPFVLKAVNAYERAWTKDQNERLGLSFSPTRHTQLVGA